MLNPTLHYLIHSAIPQNVSYYDSNYGALEHVLRLNAYPHHLLDQVLSQVWANVQEAGAQVHVIHHCMDNSVQGLILPEFSSGVYGVDFYDPGEWPFLAMQHRALADAVQENLAASGKTLTDARAIHDEEEKVYIAEMDFAAADQLTQETIDMLLQGKRQGEQAGREVHRFFGAATVNGNLDYIPDVSRGLSKRYLIKGRPGTGKSTFLKKIGQAAKMQGFDVELYHCSLDCKSLDMVVIRELDVCLFDSTAPHEYFPAGEEDAIIDIYERCVTPGTDEKYHDQLDALKKQYKEVLSVALNSLKAARNAAETFEALMPVPSQAECRQMADAVTCSLLQK